MLSLFWGFRLTIWNVNILTTLSADIETSRFRLTIWNVNQQANVRNL
ncbi:hypothetical protein [Clostridioides difficile]